MSDPVQQTSPHSADRRPLATRNRASVQRIARMLARWGGRPNTISLLGLGFGIVAGILLWLTRLESGILQRILFLLAGGSVQLRLLCNLLDGIVAIENQQASRTGELFNEVPDRISDAAALIGAGYASSGDPVLGYVAACVAIFTAYVRAMGKSVTGRQEFCGPMAKQQRMALLTAGCIYLGFAPVRWQPLLGSAKWGVMAIVLLAIIFGGMLTAARRLWRIAKTLREAT